jgi:nicotinate-nucleotide adenylyltransferase
MGSAKDYLERCTKIAILGGTFDPIHNGHLAIAEAVFQQFKPQKVLFIPTGDPPHKPDKPITAAAHRFQMVLQSICQTPAFDISRIELDRKGKSYTIDTIKALKETLANDCEVYFVVGQDALQNMDTWKHIDKLTKMCQFIAVPRPGHDQQQFHTHIAYMEKKYGATIHKLESHQLDISSTNIRKSLSREAPVSTLIPWEAEDYIRKNGLYGCVMPDLGDAHFNWAKACLGYRLTPKRFEHTLGVVIEAEKLAKHYGADANKARWAALLHDCAKEYGTDKKRMLCTQWNIPIDPLVATHIDLAHGLIGAECARRQFYVTDTDILQAIRFHISGHKGMTLLDKIIVLADFIEPFREDYHPLADMRALAYVDINKALTLGLTVMSGIDAARGKEIHHWSQDAIKALGGKYEQ